MRIGISCYPTLGGSGAVATELGKALAHRGHQVHFIVTDIPFRLGEFHQNIFVHELQTTSYPVLRTPPHDLSLAAWMADIIEQYDLEILHVHYALPFAVCAYLAKEMLPDHPFRVVTTLHGTDVTVLSQDKRLFKVMKLGIEKSDYVTAVSESLVQQTIEIFETKKDIHCVYNFIDTDQFTPITTSSMRDCLARPNEKVLLHVSNFREVKRVGDVIDIFERVQRIMPAKLLLVGEGPESTPMREKVESLGLTDQVRFLGKQDEVAQLFGAADLLLLPSSKESFGLVALEAMACGVPVIGSLTGGIPEVVVDGETGFLSDIGDVTAMAENAIRLLQDANLYRAFSVSARRRAEEAFHIRNKVAEYEAIYERLAYATTCTQ